MAARDRVLKADIVTKLPALLPTLSSAFRTDLSLTQLIALANVAAKIDRDSITMWQVDETMQTGMTTADGARVLVPKMDKVKSMVRAALGSPDSASAATTPAAASAAATPASGAAQASATPVAATTTPSVADVRGEIAKVEVLNGTNTIGLAKRTQTYLLGQGVQVVRIADATGIYKKTMLYDDGTKPATRALLIQLFSIAPENVKPLGPGGVHIRLIVGTDAKVP
jgi:hypothetical protein